MLPSLGQPLVQVILRRSLSTTTYTRSFSKVDEFFSYVGGLIGTIIGFIFIMENYNEKSYEISIAHNIFTTNDSTEIPYNSFNFLSFILMFFRNLLDIFGLKVYW